jgi:protein kinase-like protein
LFGIAKAPMWANRGRNPGTPGALLAGMPNDEYQLGELLGRGGMGQVHIARHRSGRLVAVKRVRNTLSGDRFIVERLGDEARLLRAVSHPNVVRALDDGTGHDGMPFLVMDRAHGTPLNQLIEQHGGLPRDRLVAIASQLFAGLTAIHAARIVHADLKSHNVLVDDVNIVTIIDFGLARTVSQLPDASGLVAGTPAYMAPELISGAEATAAADLYAAATIIYEMLTGSTPFHGDISTILTRQLSETVEAPSRRAPRRGITPALDRVLLRALDFLPSERYPSVAAFAAAFTAALEGRLPAEPVLAGGSAQWAEQTTAGRPSAALLRMLTGHLADRTDETIFTALAGAQALIGAHRVALAAEALETTLASLAPAHDGEAAICAGAWRIETVLAALYNMLGKQDRAQRMARVGYRHALQTGCPLAEARARAMVQRLIARPRRLARGSVGNDR